MGQLTSFLDEKFKNQVPFRQRSNNVLKVAKRANTNQYIHTILPLAHIYDKLFISSRLWARWLSDASKVVVLSSQTLAGSLNKNQNASRAVSVVSLYI
jgi:hypothetical protein